ncbi:MAG: FKBP-type peptidyl-prolyl cis-trans isomerase [Planctomycetota bacterium]|jgi:FKBP-type peptidyl-prolyl cis-trans isomerase SlyD
MQITENAVVSFAYILRDSADTIIDQSPEDQPMAYLHGHGGIISGLEMALEGRSAGDSFTVEIAPEDAYGLRDPELDLAVPLEAFPEDQHSSLQPGIRFQGPHPNNPSEALIYTVHAVEGDVVKCSGNHELAGMPLHFSIEVTDVRAATDEEIAHGHIHPAGDESCGGSDSNSDHECCGGGHCG